jgi:hypothetical protein
MMFSLTARHLVDFMNLEVNRSSLSDVLIEIKYVCVFIRVNTYMCTSIYVCLYCISKKVILVIVLSFLCSCEFVLFVLECVNHLFVHLPRPCLKSSNRPRVLNNKKSCQ